MKDVIMQDVIPTPSLHGIDPTAAIAKDCDNTTQSSGNNDKLKNQIQKAGDDVGERVWELPLWDEYSEVIKGHHSDLYNIGGPYGGTITAAMFLKEFVPEKTAWVHLDVAGTAWTTGRYDCQKGATGMGVKLFAEFITSWEKTK